MLIIVQFRDRSRTVLRRLRIMRENFKSMPLLALDQISLERFGGTY
jgi:hypothetical protein